MKVISEIARDALELQPITLKHQGFCGAGTDESRKQITISKGAYRVWIALYLYGFFAFPDPSPAQSPAENWKLPVAILNCPREIAPTPIDVGFGAYIAPHRFDKESAATLGIDAYADRKVLLVSAPLAALQDEVRVGRVAILDPATNQCIAVFTPPSPMDYWREGHNRPQFAEMQFGLNFCFSPGGRWLFVGAKQGGKGFLLNTRSGKWFDITDRFMQVSRVVGSGIAKVTPDNKHLLNYGTKAVFDGEDSLFLASNVQHLGNGDDAVPGNLLYKVILDSDKGADSMLDADDASRSLKRSPEELESRWMNGLAGSFSRHMGEKAFRRHPAMDSFGGEIISSGTAWGNGYSLGAAAAKRHHFFIENINEEGPPDYDFREHQKGTEGLPMIERCSRNAQYQRHKHSFHGQTGTNHQAAYLERRRFFPFHENYGTIYEKPGKWLITDLGLVDRERNIGWVVGSVTLDGVRTGLFGVFRWSDDQDPVYLPVALSFDGQSEVSWGGREEVYEYESFRERPWVFRTVDPEDGRLYVGVTGPNATDSGYADPGRVFVFDISDSLKQLGWEASPGLEDESDTPQITQPHEDKLPETYVTVVDLSGSTIEARLAATPEDNTRTLRVVRKDGKEFTLLVSRITRTSFDALIEAEKGDRLATEKQTMDVKATAETLAKLSAISWEELHPGPSIGDVIEFEAKSIQRRSIRLDSYRGKVVLLQFWAPWCAPCVGELEQLKEIYSRYSRSEFEIIGIAWVDDPDKLGEFVQAENLRWPQCLAGEGEDSLLTRFGVKGVPNGLLIDQEGKLVSKIKIPGQLPDQLDALLKGDE